MRPPTSEEALLYLLINGASMTATVADANDRHPQSMSRAMRHLQEEGLVTRRSTNGPCMLTVDGYREARTLLRRRS